MTTTAPGRSRRELFALRCRLHAVVAGLPAEHRYVFVLVLVQGRTCAQVARRLGVGYFDTVRTVEQVRAELRAALRNGGAA